MSILENIDEFMGSDEENEEIQDIANIAKEIMASYGKESIDDEVEAELETMFGSEYLNDRDEGDERSKLDKVKEMVNI